MNDEQLKEYLKRRPEELKTVKIQKSKPKQKVRKEEGFSFFFLSSFLLKDKKGCDDTGPKGCEAKTFNM